jgi:hypothetical protein
MVFPSAVVGLLFLRSTLCKIIVWWITIFPFSMKGEEFYSFASAVFVRIINFFFSFAI